MLYNFFFNKNLIFPYTGCTEMGGHILDDLISHLCSLLNHNFFFAIANEITKTHQASFPTAHVECWAGCILLHWCCSMHS